MPEEDIKWLENNLDNMLEKLADDYDKDDKDDYRLPHDFLSIVNYLRGLDAFYDIDLWQLPPQAAYGENNVYEMRAVVNADKVNEILRG